MIVIYIIGLILFFFLIYNFLPNFYARNISKNVLHTLALNGKKIALTFDDGPDQRYTNEILDLLKEYSIKATFFVVAEKVKSNISIIKRMKEEGHLIALHSLRHKSAWLMGPYETMKEIPKSKKILSQLDIEIDYFRPPWGTFNLLTLYSATKNKLKTILWSVEAYDWRKDNSGVLISNLLLNRIKEQSIIVLHDSGGAEFAPINTIEGLKITIPKLLEKGYEFVTVEE
ncbi:MAG: polysaccharide deacetylase family protein [Eubacteriales bacterium]